MFIRCTLIVPMFVRPLVSPWTRIFSGWLNYCFSRSSGRGGLVSEGGLVSSHHAAALNPCCASGDNGVGFNYSLTERSVLPIWLRAIQTPEMRVLAYNGDTDPGINSFVAQDKFLPYMEQQTVKMEDNWRPWTLDGKQRMGGYVTTFEGNFSFLTIRGSGHMVPEYKPAASLAFLSAFLDGKPFPEYEKPSSP